MGARAEPTGLCHRRRHMQLSRIARAGLGLALAGGMLVSCSSSHHAANPRASTTTTASTTTITTTPKDAAVALSRRLLENIALPPSAQPSDAPLPERMRAPSSMPAIGNLVQSHRVWAVPGEPHVIAKFLAAHRPDGLTPSGIGHSSSPTSRVWLVDNQIPGPPLNVSYEDLQMAVGDGGAGTVLIRADAVVGWTETRPADEIARERDRVVTVTVVHTFQPGSPAGKRVVTSDPKLVRPIARAFNRLRVAPPYEAHGCPAMGTRTVSYRVAFSTTAAAVPDVVATIGKCGGPDVTVRGDRAPSLVGLTAPEFSNAVARVLGFTEPHFG